MTVRLPLVDVSLVRHDEPALASLPEAIAVHGKHVFVVAGPATSARDEAARMIAAALAERGIRVTRPRLAFDESLVSQLLAHDENAIMLEGNWPLAFVRASLAVFVRSNEQALRKAPLARQVMARASLVVDRAEPALISAVCANFALSVG